jgi:hypothetical protein
MILRLLTLTDIIRAAKRIAAEQLPPLSEAAIPIRKLH